MTLDLWARTSGTWINVAAVVFGTAFGLLLQGRLPLRMQRTITQGVALVVLFIGLQMAGSLLKAQAGQVDGVVLGLLALVLGGLLGEWAQLESALQSVGDWLKVQFKGSGSFTEGFVAASLLFCVGPMALLGSLNNGLTGDSRILVLKSTMDGLAAIALSSSLGVGVGFSGLALLLYQGSLSLAAGLLAQALPDPVNDPRVLLVTGVGGLMIVGLGFNMLEAAQVRVASFLPALVLAPIFYGLAVWLT
ncbi:DUF554 domain-containing protein [Leptolyngbya sp. FACHB-261]|uniref:DUF554 domain-containing protein n=1 Tax=Leptolyngbya sp. FACHB-261 TaxID=2692806 RepID=UPI0016850E84|nr:DUF554 domain-containing protein [Leptolyngbya sp. FACHB-261]MBD2101960.1 DUF554 domain-containing protein [Leptolyngbya sp. FACHB-261]